MTRAAKRLSPRAPAIVTWVFVGASLATMGCGGDDDGSGPDGGGIGGPGLRGDPCGGDPDCGPGLSCQGGTCDFSGSGAEGSPCDYTAQCGPDLYCSDARVCAPSGTGVDGDPCETTADCLRLWVCTLRPEGRTCRRSEDRDVGQNCIREEQCLAGLACIAGTCSTDPLGGGDAGVDDDAGSSGDGGPSGFDGGTPTPCSDRSMCDDGSMCTIGTCLAGFCEQTLVDGDDDGYASTIIPGGCGRDCSDQNDGIGPMVNPDQTGFFGTRHNGNPPLEPGTFDWNCDGVEEHRYRGVLDCDSDGACSVGTEGWLGAEPECGLTGTWARCNAGCSPSTVEAGRQQTCR